MDIKQEISSSISAYDFFGWKLEKWKQYSLKYHPDMPEGDIEVFKQLNNLKELVFKDVNIDLKDCKLTRIINYDFDSTTYLTNRGTYFVIARNASFNSNVERSYKQLSSIHSNPSLNQLYPFYPKPINFRKLNGRNCFEYQIKTKHISLDEMKNVYFQNGLPKEHIYWIIRRITVALHALHSQDLFITRLDPKSIIVSPEEHNVKIINLSNVKNRYSKFKDNRYTVPCKEHDISLCEDLIKFMVGPDTGDIPKSIFSSYQLKDVLSIYDKFGEILEKQPGGRKYSELILWDK
jgi:hypothetical protein